MKISLVSNQNVASAARDLVPTSKKPLPFTNCKWKEAVMLNEKEENEKQFSQKDSS